MRNYGIDLLRGIAAFGIVGCHLSLSPLTAGGELARHFCDFNVAVFAVLAGMFIVVNDRREYVWKRCLRILPTYAVWSVVFVLASIVFQTAGRGVEARFSDPLYWVRVVFFGNASCHLWFLICLLYAQVIIALLDRWMPRWMWLVVGAAFVFLSASGETWYHLYPMRLFGFLCIGKGLGELVVSGWCLVVSGRKGLILLGVTVAALFAHVMLTGIVPGFIRDLIAVIPLVLLFKKLGEQFHSPTPTLYSNFATALASTSMAVFLVHPIITRIGSVVVGRITPAPYSAGVFLADWSVCWLFSLCFAALAIRIPYMRRVCQ